jgi:type IV pilus modification protein PilV
MLRPTHGRPQQQRGIGLIEALIAFLVLCLGMLAVARLQPEFRQHAEQARRRSEATRLGQQEIERLRAFTTLTAGSGASYEGIASGSRVTESDNGTRYRIDRVVVEDAMAQAKLVRVNVAWSARDGSDRQVVLDTVIAAAEPSSAGALSLAPRGVVVRGAWQRAPQVPSTARDLGDGTSAFLPASTSAQAWLFDNRSGVVTAQCNVNPSVGTQPISAQHLDGCVRLSGLLLSGEVHFTGTAPLALTASVLLDGPSPAMAPWCRTEALKTVAIPAASGVRLDAVPLDATPASRGLADWQERGETFVAYHCVIVPAAGVLRWSGRLTLVPEGWSLGGSANEWRICRVTTDLDRSGTIDQNLEHPPIYENVTGALTRQNFRLVRGDQPCPAGTTADGPNPP